MSIKSAAKKLGLVAVLISLVALVATAVVNGRASRTPLIAAGVQHVTAPAIALLPVPTPQAGAQALRVDAPAKYRQAGDAVLPDAGVTKGAVFADVNQAVLCDVHYTLGIRQPHFNDKVTAFIQYGISIHDRDHYQVDHLIPVSLGGSNAPENLWPQPYGRRGAEQKDQLEARLRTLVCSGSLDLGIAQQAVAQNWSAALDRYLGSGAAAESTGVPLASVADPFEVKNGNLCPAAGLAGATTNKGIRFTCTITDDGSLRWAKRY